MARPLLRDRFILFDDIEKEKKEEGASEIEIATELLAYQAAAFLLNGPEKHAVPVDPVDPVPTAAAENLANQLKNLGLTEYVESIYKNGVKREDLHYEHFLSVNFDKLAFHEAGMLAADKDRARQQLDERLKTVPMNNRDYLDKYTKKEELNLPYKNPNEYTYEHKPSDDDWKLYAAAGYHKAGNGGKPFTEENAEQLRKAPINQLIMKNKRTIEKLRRGDLKGVSGDASKLRRSFKFANEQTLRKAQTEAGTLKLYMEMGDPEENKILNTKEWKELKQAVEYFAEAEDTVQAIALSANILDKVEKFTKGRKSEQSDPATQRCVNCALDALAICIPDAAHNKSVKPLIDRFNQVRKWHLFQKPVTLRDYGFKAAYAGDNKLTVQKKQAQPKAKPKRRNSASPVFVMKDRKAPEVQEKKEEPKAEPKVQPEEEPKNILNEIYEEEELLDLRPKKSVVPLDIKAPEYISGTTGFEEGNEEYVPIEDVAGPKNEFYEAVTNRQPLERGMVMDAMTTMVAAEELRYTDIFSDDGYKVKIDLRAFDERVTQLKKDPVMANMVDTMMENDGKMSRQLIRNAFKKPHLGNTKEAMGTLVNRLYQDLLGKQANKQEEDVKEEIKEDVKENDLNKSNDSNLIKGI